MASETDKGFTVPDKVSDKVTGLFERALFTDFSRSADPFTEPEDDSGMVVEAPYCEEATGAREKEP